MANQWQRDDYAISDDRARLDLEVIHKFLATESYWAQGRSLEKVRRTIDNSLSFGLYLGDQQIGFARVVTDYATFAWLADVFVLDEFRGRGLAKWLVEVVLSHPQVQGLRRWLLATKDAQGLYRRYGFTDLDGAVGWMELLDKNSL